MSEPRTIEQLAAALGISPDALARRRNSFRMEHGENAETKLHSWLRTTYSENKDRVRLMGKAGGYVESFPGSLQVRGVENEPEPESVPAGYQTVITLDSRARQAAEQERTQQAQQRQLRSFTEAMRQKIRQGEDIGPYLAKAQTAQDAA